MRGVKELMMREKDNGIRLWAVPCGVTALNKAGTNRHQLMARGVKEVRMREKDKAGTNLHRPSDLEPDERS